jgi:hypothetical protein
MMDIPLENGLMPRQQQRIKVAEDALQQADCQTLTRLLRDAEKDIVTLVEGLSVMSGTGKTNPRPTDESIGAMRDVALAAIQLAHETVKKNP